MFEDDKSVGVGVIPGIAAQVDLHPQRVMIFNQLAGGVVATGVGVAAEKVLVGNRVLRVAG